MTVKELKDILDACNDTAEVVIHGQLDGIWVFEDEHVFQIFDLSDEGTVIISLKKVSNG